MAADRHSSNLQGRSLKPTLASNRTTKSPVTPRLAANTSVTTNTPLRRKPILRPDTIVPTVEASIEDGVETPVKNLNGNITPRSSARKLRVESTHSTPTQNTEDPLENNQATPSLVSPLSNLHDGATAARPLSPHRRVNAQECRPRSITIGERGGRVKTPRLTKPSGSLDLGSGQQVRGDNAQSYHASEIMTQDKEQNGNLQKKMLVSFHVDGQRMASPAVSPRATSPVLSAVSEMRFPASQFIHADGTLDLTLSPPILSPSLSAVSSRSPYFPSPAGSASPRRSPSPSKENIHLSYRKGASQIIGVRPNPRAAAPPGSILPDRFPAAVQPNSQRRDEFRPLTKQSRHVKSLSISSVDSGSSHQSKRRELNTSAAPVTSSPPAAIPTGLVAQATAESPHLTPLATIDTTVGAPPSAVAEALQISTKLSSELAVDARRERKVLDLEISNSSLLAINRSLEREIRKQKAELKHFRRLSRAGRFSTVSEHRRIPSLGGLSALTEEDPEATELNSPCTSNDDADDMFELESEISSESLSSAAQADSDARYRTRDEKRLQLDLKKHRELLADSQKIDQSLQRCLGWTEELVREGKKALEHRVGFSDVNLGGRVLSDDEKAEVHNKAEQAEDVAHRPEEEMRGSLDSHELRETTMHGSRFVSPTEVLGIWQDVKDQQESDRDSFESEVRDRDSGIVLDRPPPRAIVVHRRPPDIRTYSLD
ncbi:hypothetical protein LTR66_001436 [Elasticomyces elasticus]|nr:hypothetical protein LTR66_001436 [Elasticomyces elasticus]